MRGQSRVNGTEDDVPAVSVYGQLDPDALDPDGRVRRLWPIVESLLASSGASPWQAAPLVDAVPMVGLKLDGARATLGLTWHDVPMTAQDLLLWRQAAAEKPHLQIIVLSMSGFEHAAFEANAPLGPPLVLLDRTHLEAALCGLVSLEELVTTAGRGAVFNGTEYTSLTNLMLGPKPPDRQSPAFLPPMRLPAPWDLAPDKHDEASVRHLFSGDAGWPEPLGFAAPDNRWLISTDSGVVEVDRVRGTTSWLLPLPGCAGDPLLLPDGSLLVRRGSAILAWKDGVIRAVAGDLADTRCLFAGPHGSVWALCGHGARTLNGDTGSLALVKFGSAVGEQMRHPILFDANVLNAGWIGDLKFFLAADGHSAVLDLAFTNMVRREDWIRTPVRPTCIAIAGPQQVIMGSSDGGGVSASIWCADPYARTSALIAKLTLNRVNGLALGPDGLLFVLGDVRGNSRDPFPLILTVGLASQVATGQSAPEYGRTAVARPRPDETVRDEQAPTASANTRTLQRATEFFDAVQVEARGQKKDYRMDPRPLGQGGQADVFGAVHKSTGIRVAFKRLTQTGEDPQARLRREVDAGRRFGGHRHVMPILDHSPDHEWLVMPLADYSADHKAADFLDHENLHALVNAICEALREPHELGWAHRDLKPDNVLWLGERWVVADWGLVRGPRGQTTAPGRTPVGRSFGTEGFAAPELSVDAHASGPQADIYSIGQIIGWALTQSLPRANRALVPPDGPWRPAVQAATDDDPANRPGSVDELLEMLPDAHDPADVP